MTYIQLVHDAWYNIAMQVIAVTAPDAISAACAALARGELVIYPTETCYGIAADCSSPQAVSRLLEYKGDRHRQVAIAVASRSMAETYVELNDLASNLYTHFLPGPITVISQSRHATDPRLESAYGTLGIRYPNHAVALDLVRAYGRPITATSANTSGKKEPYSYADWEKYTTKAKQAMVTLFLDAGRLEERPTSTVVDTTLNDPAILRQGEIVVPSIPGQTFITHSPEETESTGSVILHRHLNVLHKLPLIIALQGEMGAGKTHITKGFARELGISATVASPTYTLMHEYPYATEKYQGMLYHLDTWRLADPTEIESTLHLKSLLRPGNILAIEWVQKLKSQLANWEKDAAVLVINIKELDEYTRQIDYSFSTPEWS
jgi:L-threonylcarbamoyladenylate synthase